MRILLAASFLLISSGCGSDDSGASAAGSGGATGTGGSSGSSAGGAAGSGPTVTYSGKMNEITATGATPLGEVELCADSHPGVACATADADGNYSWPALPANAEVLARARKQDYLDTTTFIATGTSDVGAFDGALVKRSTAELIYTLVGVPYDASKASVAVYVVTPDATNPDKLVGLADATISIEPASGTGPIYASEAGLPDKTAQQTTKAGGAVFAAADPGEVVVTATAAGKSCSTGRYGWPAAGSGARGPLSADAISFFEIRCE
jgi:hypothetical protein